MGDAEGQRVVEGQGLVDVPLVPGVEVRCAMPDLDGSIELGIKHGDEVVEQARVRPEDPPKPFRIDLGMIEVDVALGADNSKGEVSAKGRVRLDSPVSPKEVQVAEIDRILFRYGPAHGSVAGRTEPDPPIFDDRRFGRARMSSKNVTRVFVDDNERLLTDVGRVVKRLLWDDYPDWTFNTVACVGDFDDKGLGAYGDPSSPWFNVFLGYYQIDAPKPDWTRPFAYESAAGADSKVRFDEIARLGKTDWNYISNWMYGVPGQVVRRYDDLELEKLQSSQSDAGQIGSSRWHRVDLGNVQFVSAYEADCAGADRLVRNSLVSELWRKAFGLPNPRTEHRESFVPTRLDAQMYVAYWEDDEAFHTTIFGGTGPAGGDVAFLDRQLAESKRVIERGFGDVGFALEPKAPRSKARRKG